MYPGHRKNLSCHKREKENTAGARAIFFKEWARAFAFQNHTTRFNETQNQSRFLEKIEPPNY
jgi:hypothetical protein